MSHRAPESIEDQTMPRSGAGVSAFHLLGLLAEEFFGVTFSHA